MQKTSRTSKTLKALKLFKRISINFICFFALMWAGIGYSVGNQRIEYNKNTPNFEKIFTEYNVVMLLIDPVEGQIVDANPAAAQFYGYSQDKLRTMAIQQINTFTPQQVADERALAAKAGRNYFIFRHRLASNEVRTVEVHSQPFYFSGTKLLLSMVNDITLDRSQAKNLWHYQQLLEERVESQIREIENAKQQHIIFLLVAVVFQAVVIIWLFISVRRQRRLKVERDILLVTLQARNQELARLGEVMAHHFQEPARRLVSFAQRLLSKSQGMADEDSRQSLYFINAQAKRLSELVRDAQRYLALDHIKLSMGGQADSAAALRQSITVAGTMVEGVDIVLQEPLPWVQLAPKYLCELFGILLDNSLRYRHPDRPLYIKISATTQENRAKFRFTDNGTGISPEYREQVLGLFTRLVPNSIPGTGMGLALAYKMTHLMGGDFYIEDGLEGGTCMVFDLPLALGHSA